MLSRLHYVRSRVVRTLVLAALSYSLYALLLGVLVPWLLRPVIEQELSKALRRPTALAALAINPFALSVRLEGLEVREASGSGTLLSVGQLYVNLQLASLWKLAPILESIELSNPQVTLVRLDEHTYNISDLLSTSATPEPAPASEEPLRYSLNNIRVTGGQVRLEDRVKTVTHTVEDLSFTVPFLSNLPYDVSVYVLPSFSARINQTPITLEGKALPFSQLRESQVSLKLEGIDLPYYFGYAPFDPKFKLESGKLNGTLSAVFSQPEDGAPAVVVSGQVDLQQVKLTSLADAPLYSMERLSVAVQAADLAQNHITVEKILLQAPELHARRQADGGIDLLSLVPGSEEPPSGSPTPPAAPSSAGGSSPSAAPASLLEIRELHLADGQLFLADDSVAPSFETRLSGLEVEVRDFSTARAATAALNVRFETDAGERFQQKGRLCLDPLSAEGEVRLSSLQLPRFSPYYASSIRFSIPTGRLDVATRYRYQAGAESLTRLSGLEVRLTDLSLLKSGEQTPFLKLPDFAIQETDVDLEQRSVSVGKVSTHGMSLEVSRTASGALSLDHLTVPSKPVSSKPVSSIPVPSKPGRAVATSPKAASPPDAEPPPWRAVLHHLELAEAGVTWRDATTSPPARVVVSGISLTADELSTSPKTSFPLDLKLMVNRGGQVQLKGSASLEPLGGNLTVALKNLDLVPLWPYLDSGYGLVLSKGLFSLNGKVKLSTGKQDALKTTFSGQLALNQFNTVEKENGEPLLSWKSLDFRGVQASTEPLSMTVQQVALTDFFSRLSIHPDGTYNVDTLLQGTPAAGTGPEGETAATPGTPEGASPAHPSASPAGQTLALAPSPIPATSSPATASSAGALPQTPAPGSTSSAPAGASEVTPIRIDEVTLQGGTIAFADRSIKPNFVATLTEVGGHVSGLSSTENTRAEVNLRGKLESSSPLEISGQINPLQSEAFADLTLSFRDIELSPMTSYSGRYAGYSIEKGKLFLDLRYHVENGVLDSTNKVRLERFSFGEKVESADATRLPVQLAVSLLQDQNGEINLDLPVTGSLDDPKFNVWKVLGTVVKNILSKAAASPFALLNALGGNGEELAYVEFESGTSQLDEASRTKLRTLEDALAARPGLKLDITGHVDPILDLEQLKRLNLDKKVRAQKLQAIRNSGGTAESVQEVVVSPAEYETYLTEAYKKEPFPKPRTALGQLKVLPVAELEKLMLTAMTLGEDDLRALALERAQRVKEALLLSGKIASERVFLVEPRTLAPEKAEKLKNSRVDFVLR